MPNRSDPTWENTAQLLERECRSNSQHRIGLEIERIGVWADGTSLRYETGNRPLGAERLLRQLSEHLQWPVTAKSGDRPLGLQAPLAKISLEPGSQLEFAVNPLNSIAEVAAALGELETQVDTITAPSGLQWIGLGVNPVASVEDIDVIPLPRYHIMTEYLPKQDTLGTTMMRLTSSIQINFDYSSEKQAIEMLQVGLLAAPLSTALFGNSPLSHGRPNGWLSFRSEVWRHTDPDRQGLLPQALAPGFSFAKYAKIAWSRPLMFVQNNQGEHVRSERRSLEDIANGKLAGCSFNAENELTSLRQIFTEARLKPGYIEIRSLDGLRPADRYSAIAFWTGLIYSEEARALVLEKLGKLEPKTLESLWIAAGKQGMKASVEGLSLLELGRQVFAMSRQALVSRGLGEEKFLAPLEANLAEGKNPANRILELYNGAWKQNMGEVIRYSASR